MNINMNSLSRTTLYRNIMAAILAATDLTREEIQEMIAEPVALHIQQKKQAEEHRKQQREEAIRILNKMLSGETTTEETYEKPPMVFDLDDENAGEEDSSTSYLTTSYHSTGNVIQDSILNHLGRAYHEHGLSYTDLAKMLRVGQSTVCKWLNGTNTPNMSNLKAIAKVLRAHPFNYDIPKVG